MAEVSIIVPCHNGADYISEAIESVLNQSYSDWELLVIDDNSTDQSRDIVKNYSKKDKRIKLLINEVSYKKPFAPRNTGIKAASGRYIAFLDCDDCWLQTKLQNQISLIKEKKCPVVFSNYKKMDSQSIIISNEISAPEKVSYKQLLFGNCIGNVTGLYDTQLVGKVFQKNINHEDYVMWLDILRNGGFAFNTNTVEALYRISNTSVSASKLKAFTWTWNIYRKELKMSFISALFHFSVYAVKGLIKFVK